MFVLSVYWVGLSTAIFVRNMLVLERTKSCFWFVGTSVSEPSSVLRSGKDCTICDIQYRLFLSLCRNSPNHTIVFSMCHPLDDVCPVITKVSGRRWYRCWNGSALVFILILRWPCAGNVCLNMFINFCVIVHVPCIYMWVFAWCFFFFRL